MTPLLIAFRAPSLRQQLSTKSRHYVAIAEKVKTRRGKHKWTICAIFRLRKLRLPDLGPELLLLPRAISPDCRPPAPAKKTGRLEAASFPPDLPGGGESGAGGGRGAQGRATAAPRRARPQRARPLTRCAASALRPACREEAAVPQVSVRPAHAPQQPPAASLSEPHSYPPAVPAATGQLSRSRMRPPAVAARTVCGLGGWYVRRGPRGPQLPP